MKNLIKKILVFVMVISSLLFCMVGCDDPSNVKGENFAPSEYVNSITATNGNVTYGEEVLVGSQKLVKGAVLQGEQQSVFNLGEISINKTKWEGVVDSITAKPTSFIEFYHAPTTNVCEIPQIKITLTDVTNSKNIIEIYVSSVKNLQGAYSDDFTMVARARGQETFTAFLAKASTQTTIKVDVDNDRATGVPKTGYYGESASKLGYNDGDKISATGNANAPISFVYDKQDNALYSPVTSNIDNANASPKTSFAIRNFNNEYNGKVSGADSKWLGFKGDLVNVKLEFTKATTTSKIVVTSFGGYDISGSEVFVADNDYVEYANQGEAFAMLDTEFEFKAPVKYTPINSKFISGSKAVFKDGNEEKTIVFDSNTKPYTFKNKGTVQVSYYNNKGNLLCVNDLLVATVAVNKETLGITASQGASVDFGTYKQSAADYYYTGIKLSGGDNAEFDFGLVSLNDTFWNHNDYDYDFDDNNDDSYFENKSLYSSIIDLVFHPNTDRTRPDAGKTTCYTEIANVYVDLTNPNNPEEFVSLCISEYPSKASEASSFTITAAATNNPTYCAQRYYSTKGNIVLNRTVRRKISVRGDQKAPIEICYDNGGVYCTSTFIGGGNPGLQGAYCVRNFGYEDEEFSANEIELNGSIGDPTSYHRDTHTPWDGFTSDVVNLKVRFGNVRENYFEGDTSSIIITKFGRFDLTKGAADVEDDEFSVSVGADIDTTIDAKVTLNAPAKAHALYKNYFVNAYVEVYFENNLNKVDTINFVENTYVYQFKNAGYYTLKYYDANGVWLCNKHVNVV